MKQPAAQPVPAAPGAVKRPKPLRVVKGPDGKPRVVRRGAAAFSALQANIPKVLRIGVIQGARIIEERIIRQRETVNIGASERNHFVVPQSSLPAKHALFELKPGPKGSQYFLTFTDDMTGRVAFPQGAGGVQELAALKSGGKAVRGARGWQVALTDDCKGKIVVGDTTMLFQFVIPPPMQPPPQLPASVRGGWLGRLDVWLIVSLVLASGAHAGFLAWVIANDWPEPTLEELLASDYSPATMVPVEIEEKPPAEESDEDSKDGEGDESDSTAEGDQNAEATEDGATTEVAAETPANTGPRQPREGDVNVGGVNLSANQAAQIGAKLDQSLSLENLLGGGDGPSMGIGAEFGGVSAAVTGLDGALAGALGTSEGGDGSGGYGTATGNLTEGPAVGTLGGEGIGGTGPTGPAVVPERDDVAKAPVKQEIKRGKIRTSGGRPAGGSGRMDGNVFRSVFNRKKSAIETCYNSALVRDPTLGGDLVFMVVINQQGSVNVDVEQNANALQAAGVTDCIVGKLRTMNFTSSPPTGGDFRVRIPMSFIAP